MILTLTMFQNVILQGPGRPTVLPGEPGPELRGPLGGRQGDRGATALRSHGRPITSHQVPGQSSATGPQGTAGGSASSRGSWTPSRPAKDP